MTEFLKLLAGPLAVVTFLCLVGVALCAWRALKLLSARTAQPGGDHFILDRDAPPEQR